jgi:hypothetical protein
MNNKKSKENTGKSKLSEDKPNGIIDFKNKLQTEKEYWENKTISASGTILSMKSDLERKLTETRLLKDNYILERNNKTQELDYLEDKEREIKSNNKSGEIQALIKKKKDNIEFLNKEASSLEDEVSYFTLYTILSLSTLLLLWYY